MKAYTEEFEHFFPTNRDKVVGKSMPRKSKHGGKLARWGTHQEAKSDRAKWSRRDVPQ